MEQSWFVSPFGGSSCQASYDRPTSSKRQKIDVLTRTLPSHNIPWIDKHRPTTIGELAVHKKKIEELETLLNASSLNRQKQSPGGVILLTGPAGCGKTATVQAIATDLSIEIAEWINPVEKSVAAFSDFEHYIPGDMIFPEKQASLFRDFVSRTSRYSLLGRARNMKSKILLIEDIPNVFYRDSAELYDILSQYIQRSSGFLIFILSDSVERESSIKKLFPNQVIKDLGIEVVNFNPIATGSMVRVLEKIAVNEGYVELCRNTLEILAESSGGDVRAAINALQFACLKGCENLDKLFHSQLPVSSKTKKKGTKKTLIKKQNHEILASIGGKDANLFLFRVLGKILYGKRNQELEIYGLPPHLHNEERCQLQTVPELLVEKSTAQGSTLALFLHGNFPPFFKRLEDYSNAAESLSYADYIASQWTEDKTSTMDDYYGLVAVRGIMFSNTDVSGGVWRSLKRPYYFTASTQTKKREQFLREEFSATTGLSSFDIVSDMLPFARKLGVKFSPTTDQIVSELTSFNTQNPFEVTHLGDTFDEVDLMDIVGDSEHVISSDFGEEPAYEDAILQEEEDYVIEEFED